jgi:hypothetical protein
MKKTVILFILFFGFCVMVFGEEDKTTIITIEEKTVYDILGHEDLAMNILAGWGISSAISGSILLFNENEFLKSMGIQNILFGFANLGISLWQKNLINEKIKNGFDEQTEPESFRNLLKYGFFIDLLVMGIGTGMYLYGNEQIRGHGAGIFIQGFFLMAFDGVNFLISKNLSKRFEE